MPALPTRGERRATGQSSGGYGYGRYGQREGRWGQREGTYGQGLYGQGSYGEGIRELFGRPSRHYVRSDERIREDVYERLMDQNYMDADDVQVKVDKAEVTLIGTVPARRDKRLIEEVAESVLGVKDVHNQLRVVRNGSEAAVTDPKKARA